MTAELIDTHCHLAILRQRGLLAEALESAAAAGVSQIVAVGLNCEDSAANGEIARATPGIYFSVGWHPHEAHAPDAQEMRQLDSLLSEPLAVAVGEIGLDLYFRPGYHETPLAEQLRSIHSMFELAEQHHKPVILHDREAHSEILAVMRSHPGVVGVMHCFSGDPLFATLCVEQGYVISFSGIVTFPRSEAIVAAARQAAADSYVVETDSPYLAPVPHRGQPNLPGYVAATAAALALVRETDADSVARETTATARRLFGLNAEITPA